MKRYLVFLLSTLIFGFGQDTIAQINPGNIGTGNMTAWFRPDNLVLGPLSAWTTQFPVGPGSITLSDTYGSAALPLATNSPTNFTSNYNTTVDFAGNDVTTQKVLGNGTTLNLLNNNTTNNQGTMFAVYYFREDLIPNGGHIMNYRESSTASIGDGIQFRGLGTTTPGQGTIRLAIGSNNSTNGSNDSPLVARPCIGSYHGNKSNSTSFHTFKNNLEYTNPFGSSSTGTVGLYFGGRRDLTTAAGMNGFFTGYISEVIFYNTNLSPIDRLKVESYLAIKYAITLDNTGFGTQGDYIATDGTTIWDADDSTDYHNEIIGIGRDDAEGLMQKQSHTFDDTCRIYIDQLSISNASNGGTLNTNISYLLMGQDTMRMCATQSSNAESPANIITRLEREFKVTKTNFDQNFNWDIRIDTCSTIDFTMQPQNVRLLVDNDGDFTDANVYGETDGLTFSVIDGTLSIHGITSSMVPNDSTTFLTIGYNDVLVSLSAPSSICAGDNATFTFGVLGTSNPVTVTYTINGVTSTLAGVTNGQTFTIQNPVSTITYSIEPFVNLLNCCGNGAQAMTVTINQLPTVVANASSNSICDGDSTQLFGTGAVNYAWTNGIIDSVYFTPAATQNYIVTGTDANGCTNTDQISVTVNQTPIVTINASDTDLCENEAVTLTAQGATTYQWDNGVQNGVTFTPANTLTYEAIGFNGVCTDTATVLVTVNANPLVGANASDNQICEGESVTLTGSGAANYVWNNGAVDGQAIIPSTTTLYEVTGTNLAGCSATATVNVVVNSLPIFDLGTDLIICPDDSVTIGIADIGNNYVWNTGDITSEISVNQIGLYTLLVSDANGCTFTNDIFIDLYPSCDELIIPNVFTPNGDLSNDLFTIQGTENLLYFHLVIQNRWGNVVFETGNSLTTWDGKDRSGIKCNEGVYFYFVEYQLPQDNSMSTQQGFLHLEK